MKPDIKDELLDELLKNYRGPEDLLGPEGLFTQLKKRLINPISPDLSETLNNFKRVLRTKS